MIESIKHINAISLTEEIPTSGHSPLRVICDDYESYIIKNTRGKKPSFYLISEIICHYLATCWEIKTPEISLVHVDSDLLEDRFSGKHKARYYQDVAFGSKQVEKANDVSQFTDIIKSKYDYNRFTAPLDYLKIGLFDIWVDNDDRKPTNFNLLLGPDMEFIAIDHAYTFCTMNYKDLRQVVSITEDSSIMHTELAKGIIKYSYREQDLNTYFKEYFYLCLETCQNDYDLIIQNIPEDYGFSDELKTSLHDFLFDENRNNQVYSTFLSWL